MNIAPTLPNPQPPAQPQQRRAVSAVDAARPTRDAVDERGRRPMIERVIDESQAAALGARAEAVATRHRGHSAHVNRALAAYARIASDGERRSLHDVLGFDEYA